MRWRLSLAIHGLPAIRPPSFTKHCEIKEPDNMPHGLSTYPESSAIGVFNEGMWMFRGQTTK